MAINRIEIKDFLVFKGNFSADFGPGVNVFIGDNGTGKTTLLKCLYGSTDTIAHKTSRYFDAPGFVSSKDDVYISRITNMSDEEYLEEYQEIKHEFSPIVVFLSSSEQWNKIDEDFQSQINEMASHSMKGKVLNEKYFSNPLAFNVTKKSILIPATEMLSHSKGFLALCSELKMPFDQTQIDILAKAQFPETREIKQNAVSILEKIKKIIGGEVVYEDDTFFILKDNGNKVSFSLEASGYKKLGLLWKLLRNGLLESGTALLWDEPENSLNPELIPTLVDILLELSRNSVQIFIATHSEILASYFAVNRQNGDNVVFTSFYKENGQVKTNTSDRFDLLVPNNLTAEPVKLYEKEIEKGLGGND